MFSEEWGDIVGSPPKSSPQLLSDTATAQDQHTSPTLTTPSTGTIETTQPQPQPPPQPLQTVADVVSPTETLSLSTTDSSRDIIAQGSSSLDTLTIVSAESTSSIQSPSFENLEINPEKLETEAVEIEQTLPGSSTTSDKSVINKEGEMNMEKKGAEVGQAPGEGKEKEAKVGEMKELKMRDKGELVVVGSSSDRTTPSSESMTSTNTKG